MLLGKALSDALRAARRRLLGEWVIEIHGVRVATHETKEEAERDAACLGYVGDGAEVTIRNVGGLFS